MGSSLLIYQKQILQSFLLTKTIATWLKLRTFGSSYDKFCIYWLKSAIYLEKVSVIPYNAFTTTIAFVNINYFRHINPIML